ncbi:MAG: imidazoleglycerol-phosphate dehydratase HisB [Bacteroidota bacterium]
MNLWFSNTISFSSDILPAGLLRFFIVADVNGCTVSLEEDVAADVKQLLHNAGIKLDTVKEKQADACVYLNAEGQIHVKNDTGQTHRFENWVQASNEFIFRVPRTAQLARNTNETDISVSVNLDGTGVSNIDTGLHFFDHMLEQISRHGLIDLDLSCKGDLEVDEHHTIEDVAIALGTTLNSALGDKKGLERYAFVLPMDESQATVAIDFSGRPYLVFECEMTREYVGDFPTEMLEHFFYSLAMNLKATLHVTCIGKNDHHKIEACFKGLARVLKKSVEINSRIKHSIPSSKGTI